MSRLARTVSLVLFMMLGPGAGIAYAQADPNNARGFRGDVFQMGDFDNVNIFNGNLVVRLPIGQAYASGPSLTYQFVLTANSKVWDFKWKYSQADGNGRLAIPELESNAGLGWTLSLGRLIEPRAATAVTAGTSWTFLGSDGGQHEFGSTLRTGDPQPGPNVLFTNDGSYLRLKLGASFDASGVIHQVESPDGTIYEFHDPNDPAQKTRLTKIRDRFDNWVKIDYSSPQCEPGSTPVCELWTITDGHGDVPSTRTHTVRFKNTNSIYVEENFHQVVDAVTLSAFGGATPAKYTFRYVDDPPGSSPTSINRDGCGDLVTGESSQVSAPLLQSILLPDNTSFSMTTSPGGADCSSGALASLTLPTGGIVKWEYGDYEMPLQDCTTDLSWTAVYSGVTKRSFFQPATGTTPELLEGFWTYEPAITPVQAGTIDARCNGHTGVTPLSVPHPPREFTNTVTNPSGDKSVHYFSVYPFKAPADDQGPFNPAEYGRPFTRNDQLENGALALSSATLDCDEDDCPVQQKTYVQYANDGVTYRGENYNSRLVRQKVTHVQDTGCGGVCSTETAYSDFDGYGHFRKSTVTSNFPSSIAHVTFTNFNPGSSSTGKDASNYEYFGTTEPWILGTYGFSWVKQGTSAAKTQYDFDATTGALRSTRRLKNGLVPPATDPGTITSSVNDLLTAYCRDTNTDGGARGFVTSERLFGGDKSAIPSSDLCQPDLTRVAGQYFNDSVYEFTAGDLTTRKSGWADSGFLSTDVDFDPSTGLVKTSRDSTGLETKFAFDNMGRITEIRPPHQGWTRYVYSPAAEPARVEAQVWAYGATPSAGTDPIQHAQKDDYSYFDGFGRLILSKSRMPPAPGTTTKRWATTKTEYDAAGRVSAVYAPVSRATPSFEELTPQNKTTHTYDVFGRAVRVLSPDGSSTVTSHTGHRKRELSFVEATTPLSPRLRSTEEYDGRGRLIKVIEPAKATSITNLMGSDVATTYGYDLADRLVSVRTDDGQVVQERSFSYDNRGWLKSERHPEKGTDGNGTVSYGSELDASKGHDAAGLVWYREEGAANEAKSSFAYDSAQRLISVKDGAEREIKTFDFSGDPASGHPKGKLYRATRYNYLNAGTIVVSETYQYTGLGGRPSQRDTKVEHRSDTGTATTVNEFSQTVAYESNFARPQTIGYPTCSVGCSTTNGLPSVGQVFDKGSLTSVTGYATFGYHPTGMVAEVKRTNPSTSKDTYAADWWGLARPASISFTGLSSCTPPSQPQIDSAASVCPSSTANQASVVNFDAGSTYTWSITGGTITGPTTGNLITFSAHPSGSISLTVTSTNACGSVVSAPRTISVNGPAASLRPGTSIDRGQQATLTVDLTGTGPWNLTWTDGHVQNGITTSPATRPVTPLVTTTYSLQSVSDATCGTGTVTGNPTITVYPPSPSSITAMSNNLVVTLSWPASSGATSYKVERGLTRTGSFFPVGTTSLLEFNDTVPPSATPVTYVYRVRAVDSEGTSSQPGGAPLDFATTATVLFAENVAQGSRIRGSYVTELQKAVDALRVASGLPPAYGSYPSLAGAPVAATYFTSILGALDDARAIWGLPPFVYSGVPRPAPGIRVYAVYVTQLRAGVQ